MIFNTKSFFGLFTISAGLLILFRSRRKNSHPKRRKFLEILEENLWENGDAAC